MVVEVGERGRKGGGRRRERGCEREHNGRGDYNLQVSAQCEECGAQYGPVLGAQCEYHARQTIGTVERQITVHCLGLASVCHTEVVLQQLIGNNLLGLYLEGEREGGREREGEREGGRVRGRERKGQSVTSKNQNLTHTHTHMCTHTHTHTHTHEPL